MAEPTPVNNKNRTRRHLLLSLLAVAVIAALAVMTTSKPAAPEYRRYVGLPLPDGSRVTFLYPASAAKFPVGQNGNINQVSGVQYVEFTKPGNIGEQLLHQLPIWRRFRSRNDCMVSVFVYSLNGHFGGFRSGRVERPFSGVSQDSDSFYGDSIDEVDARSRLDYHFQYVHSGTLAPAGTEKGETIITNSFRVLPPGAAVPTP